MAIEQLGESLLAQAKKKSKKEERKAKQFMGLLLGIQAGNAILRNKAKKRAETFLTSNAGLINQRTKQFNKGIEFWDGHTKMMSKYGATGIDDWENAKRQELYDLYKTRELGGATLDKANLDEFKNRVNPLIEDEMKAYGEKLELFQNFRNIKDTAEERKRFLKPIQDKLDKGVEVINKQSNVGGFLLGQLGLKSYKSKLEDPTMVGDVQVVLPEGFDPKEREQLIRNIETSNKFLKSLSAVDQQVKYVPLSAEDRSDLLGTTSMKVAPIATHSASLRNALSYKPEIQAQSLFSEYKFMFNNKEMDIRKIYSTIQDEQGIEAATAFASDILTYSRAFQQQFEKTNVQGEVKSAEYFLKQGVDTALAQRFQSNGETIQKDIGQTIDLNQVVDIDLPGAGTVSTQLGALQNKFINILDSDKDKSQLLLNTLTEQLSGTNPEFINVLENMFSNKYTNMARQGPVTRTNIAQETSLFEQI